MSQSRAFTVTMVNSTVRHVCTDRCTGSCVQSESTETPSENICLNNHEKIIATLASLGFESLILFFTLSAQEKNHIQIGGESPG